MAFATKYDYCGLVAATTPQGGTAVLDIRSANQNKSYESYAPDGENGNTIAVEAYGHNETPACEYALKANLSHTAGTIQLGKLVSAGPTGDQLKYRLTSVKISTSVNSPVKITANAQMVQDSATDVATQNFDVPAFALTTRHLAQDIFSAFTITGGNLISCDADITAKATVDTITGYIISNGIGSGVITVSGTVLVNGSSEPELEEANGWSVTKPLSCDNPETAYRQYTFELKKPLAFHTSSNNAAT